MSEPTAAPRSRRRPAAATAEDEPGAPGIGSGSPVMDAHEPGLDPPADAVSAGAQTLRLERGGIAEATASQVEVRLGGIGALTAEDVFVQWGGVGAARADQLSVEFGSVGAALAGEARVTQGFAGSIAAREATLEQGIVRTLIAQHVTINRPSAVLVLIAQKVSGDVRPLLDWRGAIAAGAAFGLVTALVRIARRGD